MSINFFSLSKLKPALDSCQNLDGNVKKSIFVDEHNICYFVKKYHPISQPRDAIYEYLGQNILSSFGIECAETFLFKESNLYLISKNILNINEKIITLRSFKIEARNLNQIILFYQKHFGNTYFILKVLIADALINNAGRHTGNLGIIINNKGEYVKPCPIFDSVAFDNTRLAEAAKNNKYRWIDSHLSSNISYQYFVETILNYLDYNTYKDWINNLYIISINNINLINNYSLLLTNEKNFMIKLLDNTMQNLLKLGKDFL